MDQVLGVVRIKLRGVQVVGMVLVRLRRVREVTMITKANMIVKGPL